MHHTTSIRQALLSLMLVMTMSTPMLGRDYNWHKYNGLRVNHDDERQIARALRPSIEADMASRLEPAKVLSCAQYLLNEDEEHYWTNGIYLYYSAYYPDERVVYFHPDPHFDIESSEEQFIFLKNLKVKGKVLTIEGMPGSKVTVEQVGGHIMLVERNVQGQPVMTLHHVTREQVDDSSWTTYAMYLLWGNYSTPDGKHVVFGPQMEHYNGYDEYISVVDPGAALYYHFNEGRHDINILYGNHRVSRGNPSSPNWHKMPGGGGAGAIMGPMEWLVAPTVEGMTVTLLHDEPFVDHYPAIGEEGDVVQLVKEQCPYEGLPGKWAFASIIPLTTKTLEMFPKEVLTLMRGEIYARHGDTFKDPATQRYFDAQPWYKPTGEPVQLTDLERFNYQLIKYFESTMH